MALIEARILDEPHLKEIDPFQLSEKFFLDHMHLFASSVDQDGNESHASGVLLQYVYNEDGIIAPLDKSGQEGGVNTLIFQAKPEGYHWQHTKTQTDGRIDSLVVVCGSGELFGQVKSLDKQGRERSSQALDQSQVVTIFDEISRVLESAYFKESVDHLEKKIEAEGRDIEDFRMNAISRFAISKYLQMLEAKEQRRDKISFAPLSFS